MGQQEDILCSGTTRRHTVQWGNKKTYCAVGQQEDILCSGTTRRHTVQYPTYKVHNCQSMLLHKLRQRSSLHFASLHYWIDQAVETFFFYGWTASSGPEPLIIVASRSHTHTHTHTLGRTPLDEWSARHRGFYPITHNTKERHPCPRRDSNLQSLQTNGRRPTPYTALPLGSAEKPFRTAILF